MSIPELTEAQKAARRSIQNNEREHPEGDPMLPPEPDEVRVMLAHIETLERENNVLVAGNQLLLGAVEADTARLRAAAERVGILFVGCDTADHLAERILELEVELTLQRQANRVNHDEAQQYEQHLKAHATDLEKALTDLMAWGVEYDDARLSYIGVQVDRAAVEQAKVSLTNRG